MEHEDVWRTMYTYRVPGVGLVASQKRDGMTRSIVLEPERQPWNAGRWSAVESRFSAGSATSAIS